MIGSPVLVRSAAKILIATLFMLVYCAVQRGPFLYADSLTYFNIGREGARAAHLTPAPVRPNGAGSGHRSATVEHAPDPAARAARIAAKDDLQRTYTISAARSPYYAVFSYAMIALGSGWLLVAVQGLLIAAILFVAWRNLAGGRGYVAGMAALVLFSSLPVFSNFLMPDFAAAPSILAATLLVARWNTLSRGERIFLICLLSFGCLAHTTHRLTAGALGAAGLLATFVLPSAAKLRLGAIAVLLSALLGVVGAQLYPLAVRAMIHERIYSPPFLTARVFVDGPGRAYLRHACAGHEDAFAMCRFRDRWVLNDGDFLWGPKQFYGTADNATRVRMSMEDKRVFLGTLLYDPVGVITKSAVSSLTLMVQSGPGQVIATQDRLVGEAEIVSTFAPAKIGCGAGEARCLPRLRPVIADILAGAGVLFGLIGIIVLLARRLVDREMWLPLLALVFGALIVNATLCASFSALVPRYQARVAWLVPALALLMAASASDRRRREAAGRG